MIDASISCGRKTENRVGPGPGAGDLAVPVEQLPTWPAALKAPFPQCSTNYLQKRADPVTLLRFVLYRLALATSQSANAPLKLDDVFVKRGFPCNPSECCARASCRSFGADARVSPPM